MTSEGNFVSCGLQNHLENITSHLLVPAVGSDSTTSQRQLLSETEKTFSVPAFWRLFPYLKGYEACWRARLLSAYARAVLSLLWFPPSWHIKPCTKPCHKKSVLEKKGSGVHKEPKFHYHTFQTCNGPLPHLTKNCVALNYLLKIGTRIRAFEHSRTFQFLQFYNCHHFSYYKSTTGVSELL